MLPEVLGAPEDLPLEPVEHMSFAICSVIPSGVRCASARRLISEFMARWTLEKTKFRRWIACSAHVLRARGPEQSCAVLVAVVQFSQFLQFSQCSRSAPAYPRVSGAPRPRHSISEFMAR